MISLRNAEYLDYSIIDVQPFQKAFTDNELGAYYKRARMLGSPTAGVVGDKVIVIADIIAYGSKYLAWCLISNEVKSNRRIAIECYRRLKRTLEMYTDKPIVAHVMTGDEQAIRMIEKLGFKRGETIEALYNGDSYYLYEKAA